MNRQLRTLLFSGIGVVVLGALLAVLLLLPNITGDGDTSSASTSSDPSIVLVDKSTGADGKTVEMPVKKVTIKINPEDAQKDEDGNIVVVAREGDEFEISPNGEDELIVQAYQDLPVNTYAVETLTEALASITASKKVIDKPEDPAAYGLETPDVTVKVVYHDDTELTLELGNETPLKEGFYFRIGGEDAIYLVDTSLGDTLLENSLSYIGTTLYSLPAVDDDDEEGSAVLRDMELSGRIREGDKFAFRITTNEDDAEYAAYADYIMTYPFARSTNSESVSSLASEAGSLTATRAVIAYPTAEDLAAYGFDDPYSVAKLTVAVKTTEETEDDSSSDEETLGKTKFYNVSSHTVTLGSKDGNGYYYCMIDDVPVIYLVASSSVSWAEVQYDDIADTQLFATDIQNVNFITLTNQGEAITFKLEHFPDETESNNKLKVTVDGEQLDTLGFRRLYQLMMSIKRTGAMVVEPSGEPEISLRVVREGVEDILAEFFPADANTYTCRMNTGEVYKVSAGKLENLLKQMNNYLNGEDVYVN